ncbi:MAG: hypothetical protein WAM97_21100 [Acidimicrobiales bacterium]
MTTMPGRPGQRVLELDGVWLSTDSPEGPWQVPGLSVTADSRGLTIAGANTVTERTIPWSQTTRFSCHQPTRLRDGSPATVLEIGLANGRTLQLLLPVSLVPPSETLVVETELSAMSNRFRRSPEADQALVEEVAQSLMADAGPRITVPVKEEIPADTHQMAAAEAVLQPMVSAVGATTNGASGPVSLQRETQLPAPPPREQAPPTREQAPPTREPVIPRESREPVRSVQPPTAPKVQSTTTAPAPREIPNNEHADDPRSAVSQASVVVAQPDVVELAFEEDAVEEDAVEEQAVVEPAKKPVAVNQNHEADVVAGVESDTEGSDSADKRDLRMLHTLVALIALVIVILLAELVLVFFFLNHNSNSGRTNHGSVPAIQVMHSDGNRASV